MFPSPKVPLYKLSSILSPILWSSEVSSATSSEDENEITIINERSLEEIHPCDDSSDEIPQFTHQSEIEQEVRQASQLLIMALRSQDSDSSGTDIKLQRAIIIHSLSRLISAAKPEGMSPAEICEMRAALPEEVLQFSKDLSNQEPYQPQNKLEELVVTVVRAFFVGMKTAAPYTKEILLALAKEERKYKLTENLVSVGYCTVDILSRNYLFKTAMNNSKWVFGSVLRGISQGMMVMVEDSSKAN